MARNLKELGALVVLVAERGEPRRATPEDRRRHSDRFDVIDRRRAAVEPRPRRKWRLEARLALLALEAFEHRGLFAADIGARAAMDEDVEIIARAARVLAEEALAIGLGDGGKEDRKSTRLNSSH